ncbi:MAG TPA: septum formation initiator family protein [Lacibacter sp.]|nr:septum formation initiator family protein [Lacibacter sp.]HMO88148.1 septum formation initiator family protein [Lacibacter sp.]HMP86005.1 septum formation initiator family protein [Lacibacter sp.]
MQFLARIPSVLTNKYVLTLIGLGAWMLFFDRNDLFSQFNRFQKLRELKSSSAYYDQRIEEARAELERRKTDPTAFERIAREKYFMKKDKEDLFVFDE